MLVGFLAIAFVIAIPLNKFAFKKEGTAIVPLTTLGPLFCSYVFWGIRFVFCNCPGKEPSFRRWNCKSLATLQRRGGNGAHSAESGGVGGYHSNTSSGAVFDDL